MFSLYGFIAFLIFMCLIPFSLLLKNPDQVSVIGINEIEETITLGKDNSKAPISLQISNGDTLASILGKAGVQRDEKFKVINTLKDVYDLKKLNIGKTVEITFDNLTNKGGEALEENRLQSLRINIDRHKDLEIYRTHTNDFAVNTINIPLKKYVVRVKGLIESSFISTATNLGVPHAAIIELVKAYSYDIDFQREIKSGNEIDIIYEKYYKENGQYSHDGSIVFASLALKDRKVNLYRYVNKYKEIEYLTDSGRSVKKDLLRTPINAARISSGFGMRKHPILGYSKLHTGVDFAAPIGTPVFSAGNGTVVEIGHKGSYGNYIKVKHNNSYSTAYAHLSRFKKGLKRGMRVKQGEIIAYVGTTGRSTGPHLHYEVLLNNKHVNPLSVKLTPGVKLAGEDLNKFNQLKARINTFLAMTESNKEYAVETIHNNNPSIASALVQND